MEKALYPSKVIRITQKDHEGTHRNSFAVDEAGADGGIGNLIAPFTGTIKRVYTNDANEVWLESVDKVEYADGTIDYMTILFAHDNIVSDLRVGQVIPQGQVFYQEGTKGQASGNHCHFECGKGKFTGTGWHSSPDGTWNINKGKLVTECLWIDDSYKVINTKGYNFKKIQNKFGTPVARDESKYQVEVLENNLRAREMPNGKIKGYVNKGLYNVLEWKTTENGSYEWFRVEDGLWFANGEWCKTYKPKLNECDVKIEELEAKIKMLEEAIKLKDSDILDLKKAINDKDTEIANVLVLNTDLGSKIVQLQQELENKPTSVFKCAKTGMYKIKLYKDEELFVK